MWLRLRARQLVRCAPRLQPLPNPFMRHDPSGGKVSLGRSIGRRFKRGVRRNIKDQRHFSVSHRHLSSGFNCSTIRAGMRQGSKTRCHGAQARQKVGARHARKPASAGFLRVAPLPPRKQARGAFAPPCAPCRSGGVGTRGVPPRSTPSRLRRASNKGLGLRQEETHRRVYVSKSLLIDCCKAPIIDGSTYRGLEASPRMRRHVDKSTYPLMQHS